MTPKQPHLLHVAQQVALQGLLRVLNRLVNNLEDEDPLRGNMKTATKHLVLLLSLPEMTLTTTLHLQGGTEGDAVHEGPMMKSKSQIHLLLLHLRFQSSPIRRHT